MKKAVFTLGSINLVAMGKNYNGCNFMCARHSGNFFNYFLLTTLLVQKIQNLIKRTFRFCVSIVDRLDSTIERYKMETGPDKTKVMKTKLNGF